MSLLVVIDAFAAPAHKLAQKAIAAASLLHGPVEVLVVGTHASATAEAIRRQPVQAVYVVEAADWPFPSAEQLTTLVHQHFSNHSGYLTASNSTGKDFLPRLAMLLKVQPVTDIVAVVSPTTFKRPIYAGNVVVTVECTQPVKCLSIRPTAFTALADGDTLCPVHVMDIPPIAAQVRYDTPAAVDSSNIDVTTAAMVISAGNGIGTREKFEQVQQLAKHLGAGVGASRALVDSGVVANEYQIGQTGKVVAPQTYIALGISGAIQHLAGMKDSGTIIAVNRDAAAPIAAVSDYMLVADLDDVMPQLLQAFSL